MVMRTYESGIRWIANVQQGEVQILTKVSEEGGILDIVKVEGLGVEEAFKITGEKGGMMERAPVVKEKGRLRLWWRKVYELWTMGSVCWRRNERGEVEGMKVPAME